jgi:hypothetical protein
MVNLFLLGLASDHNNGLSFTPGEIAPINSIGSRIINRGINFSDYLKSESNTFVNLERSPITGTLKRIFDIEIGMIASNSPQENTASMYNADLLELISKRLSLKNKLALRPMFSSCMEQVNLRFNQIQLLRSEFISLDFGGASSEWNNIKLAECVSRIVTGKKVKARLIMNVTGNKVTKNSSSRGPGETFETFDGKVINALQWVKEGMALVAKKGGTAKSLLPTIENTNKELEKKKLRIKVLSKTGSPRKYDKGLNSAVFIFAVLLEKRNGTNWDRINGISGAIYIENRGHSELAVTLASGIIEPIVEYLKNQYPVEWL